MADLSQEQILASYAERKLNLKPDSSRQELSGQLNKDGTAINRTNVHVRDLSDVQVSATLKRVQYGKWEQEKACLLSLEFKFGKSSHKQFRIRKANVNIGLKSRTSRAPEDRPVVRDFGPRSLRSIGTDSTEASSWTGALSLKASLGPVEVGPEIERSKSKQYVRYYAQEIYSEDLYDQGHDKPNRVSMWATEDAMQETGAPRQILATVIFSYRSDVLATVKVDCNTLFNMMARPWGKDDPILLDERVPWGPPIRPDEPGLDFATLTDKEWQQLVTPDLVERDVLHRTQQAR